MSGRWHTRCRLLWCGAILAIPLGLGAFVRQSPRIVASIDLFQEVMRAVQTQYPNEVPVDSLYTLAAIGIIRGLNDPFSTLTSTSAPPIPGDIPSVGIGATVRESADGPVLGTVDPKGSAAECGAREGDVIVEIDSQSTKGLDVQTILNRLMGAPGTTAHLTVRRAGVAVLLHLDIPRVAKRVPGAPASPLVSSTLVAPGIGYVRLRLFMDAGDAGVRAAMDRLAKAGATKMIVDVRDNGGGLSEQAVFVANLFLAQHDTVMIDQGKTGTPPKIQTADEIPAQPTIPLIVLVNGNTASSSEVFAGALQDYDRALLLGTTTFGKGVGQTIVPVRDNYALRLTVFNWFTPRGRWVQRKHHAVSPLDGNLFVNPDSVESDATLRTRPIVKSKGGRPLYNGGGLVPDVIVHAVPPTARPLAAALAMKYDVLGIAVREYVNAKRDMLGGDVTVTPALRKEIIQRARTSGVVVDDATVTTGAGWLDAEIGTRLTQHLAGDSVATAKYASSDAQLQAAIRLLQRAPTQESLFAIVRGSSNSASK